MLPQFSMDVNPNMQSNLHLVLKNHVEAKYRAMQEAELAAAEAERAAELDRLNTQAWASVVLQEAHGVDWLDIIAIPQSTKGGWTGDTPYYFLNLFLNNGSLQTVAAWRVSDFEQYLPDCRWNAIWNTEDGEVWKQFDNFLDAALFAVCGAEKLADLQQQ